METLRKVALVTGAAKGIGKAIALALGKAGYDVAVNYHSHGETAEMVSAEIREMGRDSIAVYADMGLVDDIREMYGKVVEHYGRLDLVVNDAGVSSEKYFLDVEERDFDSMTAIDWKGLFFSSQCAAKAMIAHDIHGVIVNLSSNQVNGCWPRATVYAPTKAAVDKFTKNCAMELIPHHIRMVAIAPGYTDVGWPKDDIRWKAAERLPMRRFATCEEIAAGIVYLASDQAGYITGTTLVMDGGATLPVVPANDFV